MNVRDEGLNSGSLSTRCDLIFFPCMELRLENQIYCAAVTSKCRVNTTLTFHLDGLQLSCPVLMPRVTRSLFHTCFGGVGFVNSGSGTVILRRSSGDSCHGFI